SERPKDGERTERVAIEVFAHGVLEQRDIDDVFLLRDPNPGAEVADGLRRVAPSSYAGNRRQTRVVPSRHQLLLHEGQQLALTQHRVVQIEPCELDLLRSRLEFARRTDERVNTPVLQGPMILELERAQ